MDDETVDGLVLVVLTLIGGLFYGAAGYFFLGLALWLGAKGVGVEAPFRIARQVVAFAAVPIALSAVVVVPLIAVQFGWDWFHTTGATRRGSGTSSSASGSRSWRGRSRSSRSGSARRSGCRGGASSARCSSRA